MRGEAADRVYVGFIDHDTRQAPARRTSRRQLRRAGLGIGTGEGLAGGEIAMPSRTAGTGQRLLVFVGRQVRRRPRVSRSG
jgi:hypothetical protein